MVSRSSSWDSASGPDFDAWRWHEDRLAQAKSEQAQRDWVLLFNFVLRLAFKRRCLISLRDHLRFIRERGLELP